MRVEVVGVSCDDVWEEFVARLDDEWFFDAPWFCVVAGWSAIVELAALDVDVVFNAVVGVQGFCVILAVFDAGRVVALANKEFLIAGGSFVTSRAWLG